MVKYVPLDKPYGSIDENMYLLFTRETFDPNSLEARVIEKLMANHAIGSGRHMAEEDTLQKVPISERGKAREALKKLIRSCVVQAKPTRYGREVMLNPLIISRSN